MNKLKEALLKAFKAGHRAESAGLHADLVVDGIILDCGPMFTQEEMKAAMADAAAFSLSNPNGMYNSDQIIDRILGRRPGESVLGEQDRNCPSCGAPEEGLHYADCMMGDAGAGQDDTPTIKASEIKQVIDEKLPVWVEWIAKDADHTVYLYEKKPELNKGSWDVTGGELKGIGKRVYFLKPMTLYRVCREMSSPKVDLSITGRLAAIEKRLLAAGHLKKCEKVRYRSGDIMGINEPKKCTCGRDDIEDIVNELAKTTKE